MDASKILTTGVLNIVLSDGKHITLDEGNFSMPTRKGDSLAEGWNKIDEFLMENFP